LSVRFSLDLIVDSLNYALVVTDIKGCICYANRFAQDKFKIPPHFENYSIQIADILPFTGLLLINCLKEKKAKHSREIIDENVTLLVQVNPVIHDGNVVGAVFAFSPLPDAQNKDRELEAYRNLNRELNAVFQSSSDGIWVCNGEGRIINCNKASEALNGITLDKYRGAYVRDLVKKEKIIDQSVTSKVLEYGRTLSMVQYVQRTQKQLLVTGTPVFDEDGSIALVVVNERDMTELNATKKQLEQSRMETEKIRDELTELNLLELKDTEIIAESEQMRQVLRIALKLARIEASNLLILGESGTGKGLLTRFIHQNSRRNKKPFIQINCAALPENLLEAELFGYEKGAFTGANEQGKVGLFELAHKGTLFLDEIGDLPLPLQAKLLKYLDDHEIMHLGGIRPRKVDCMIIAATNRDLETLAKQKKFRQDLFYRLNTFTIRIPPLRERSDYLYELVNHFLRKYNTTYKLNRSISPRVLQAFQSYPFPGNVRELKNILKKAVVMSDGDSLDDFILNTISEKTGKSHLTGKDRFSLTDELQAVEKELLKKARSCCRTTRDMADFLKISQPSVVRKMKKFGLS